MGTKIYMNNIPQLGEGKNAVYDGTPIIGRSSPLHTYHYSDTRRIDLTFHFVATQSSDLDPNYGLLSKLRLIQSAVYPRSGTGGASFSPPPVCQMKCGELLANQELCVILESFKVRFPDDVVWVATTLCPYKFDVDTAWWVVYTSNDLPDQSRIFSSGR